MTTETLAPAATRRLATALLFTPQQRHVPTGDRLDLRLSWADRAAVQPHRLDTFSGCKRGHSHGKAR